MGSMQDDVALIMRHDDVDSVSTGSCADTPPPCTNRGMWSFKGVTRCTFHTAQALRKAGRE